MKVRVFGVREFPGMGLILGLFALAFVVFFPVLLLVIAAGMLVSGLLARFLGLFIKRPRAIAGPHLGFSWQQGNAAWQRETPSRGQEFGAREVKDVVAEVQDVPRQK